MADSPAQALAPSPILETKLYRPARRPVSVARPRLVRRLDEGAARRLTLIAAPAGSGKTTLLAEWLADRPAGDHAAAWLSLDRADNDPALFWSYVVAALQRARPGVGERARALLALPQAPSIETVLTTLINEIAAIADGLTLILDDFHAIEAPAIHEGLAFLLDHMPPRMRLVIAGRADPPLPLARLRARGELTELRAADLRFTEDEAGVFLDDVMGLHLSAGDVAALEARTEGWIAGLQLAALSMQGRDDASGFIRAFAGDDRYIVDYLAEEVLQRQPERARTFLVQTSILERLNGALCDAVTGRDDGQAMLERLERESLFVVPLDDKRGWFRYHHLFADVLRARSLNGAPGQVAELHRRASEWYERNGLRPEAIRHALAAGDIERAGSLVELSALAMLGNSGEDTLRGWLDALPDEAVRSRPVLNVYAAFASLGHEGFAAAETRLREAELWLDTTAYRDARPGTPSFATVVADEEALRSLPGTIAIARAYLAGAREDVAGIVVQAQSALDLLPDDDHLWRGAAASLLGIAWWTTGDLEAAHRSFAESVDRQRLAGHVRFEVIGAHILADISIGQGRLRAATRTYEQALRLATAQGEPVWGTADIYVGLSELCRERDDLEAATAYLLKSKELGEHAGLPETRHRWYLAMARIKEIQGDPDGALDLLDEAERRQVRSPDPDLRPVAALRAGVWLRQDRPADAEGWVRERDLTVDDELSYVREFEHMTLARVLIARFRNERSERSVQDAIALLERLLTAAERERTGSVIEILVLQALAHEARDDIAAALRPLSRALALAEPEDYIRTFVDEGVPMRALLRHAAAAGIAPSYTRRLLSAFDAPARPAPSSAAVAAAALVEPLTPREVDILRLIAAGLRNQEIADYLVISLATVKRHIANAYGKLGVGHRTEAVARATALGLL